MIYDDTLSHAALSVERAGDQPECHGGPLSPPRPQSRSAPDIVSQTTLQYTRYYSTQQVGIFSKVEIFFVKYSSCYSLSLS